MLSEAEAPLAEAQPLRRTISFTIFPLCAAEIEVAELSFYDSDITSPRP
jgi:hypothetical protein